MEARDEPLSIEETVADLRTAVIDLQDRVGVLEGVPPGDHIASLFHLYRMRVRQREADAKG